MIVYYTKLGSHSLCFVWVHYPTNNALLTNFLLSSDAEILLRKLPTEQSNRCQTCKNVYAMRAYSDWASILHTTVVGWVRTYIYLSSAVPRRRGAITVPFLHTPAEEEEENPESHDQNRIYNEDGSRIMEITRKKNLFFLARVVKAAGSIKKYHLSVIRGKKKS